MNSYWLIGWNNQLVLWLEVLAIKITHYLIKSILREKYQKV